MSYEDLYEMFGPGEGRMKAASEACISELPWFMVSETNSIDMHGERISCTICLQVSYIYSVCVYNVVMVCVTWFLLYSDIGVVDSLHANVRRFIDYIPYIEMYFSSCYISLDPLGALFSCIR